jgi:hypothetical protein
MNLLRSPLCRAACPRSLLLLAAAAALAGNARGQQSPLLPQNPNGQFGAFNPITPFVVPQSQDNVTPRWVEQRPSVPFTGFPVFPSRLAQFGAYPAAAGGVPGAASPIANPLLGGSLQGLLGGAAPPPTGRLPISPLQALLGPAGAGQFPGLAGLLGGGLPAAEATDGWPAWASLRGREPLPFAEDLGLLVRHGDRVWWQPPEEEASIPLYFHDKFRTLRAGALVEVKQQGEFEVLLHVTTRIVCRGQTRLRVEELAPDRVRLALPTLSRVQLRGQSRSHEFLLPDGSRLLFPAASGPDAGACDVLIERPPEPGWLGGRAVMFNSGQRDVQWVHATGTTTLPPGHRLAFFLTPPTAPMTPSFVADGGTPEFQNGQVSVQAADGAVVRWSGARFTLPAGAVLQIDPLQGDPFPPLNPGVGQ